MTELQIKMLKRLNKKTIKDSITGCWLYQHDTKSSEYPRLSVNKVIAQAHRLSAHIYLGLSLADKILQANHKPECRNKNCWNPDHIYVGTQTDNMKDEIGLRKKDYCKLGHFKAGWTLNNGQRKRYCRICHNEQSKKSEKSMNHSAQTRYRRRRGIKPRGSSV